MRHCLVSRAIAQNMINHGYQTYVLNRNTKPQIHGVHLIQADRYHLNQQLSDMHFDVVVDIAYNGEGIRQLLDHLASFDDYLLISFSAVYPDTESQPFSEETSVGNNTYWGKYGTDKIKEEQVLLSRVPHAHILRPPYLYSPGNNVYREAFVFECALQGRPFYLPGDGDLPLQFFHIDDLCTMIHILLGHHPQQHIFNTGNADTITIREWVQLCYQTAGYTPQFVHVPSTIPQRSYFPFSHYAYRLDTEKIQQLLAHSIPMEQGLQESFTWYIRHKEDVRTKPFRDYIDQNLSGKDL